MKLETDLLTTPDETPGEAAKKPYETPAVTEHGTVADITHAAGLPPTDGITGIVIGSLPSDRAIKQDFAPVDPREILTRLASMPVESWSYSFQDPSVRHIGPMAQDFSTAFGVGDSDKKIDMVDANGVSIVAIQALYGMIQERDGQIAAMRAEIEEIKRGIGSKVN